MEKSLKGGFVRGRAAELEKHKGGLRIEYY
jgi:hypothetical protein